MQANNTQESQDQNQAATTQAATNASGEEQKSFAERMATMPQPKVDTRVKTEDVTATQGLTFRDFNLAESVQFVSLSLHVNQISLIIGHF